MTLGCDMLDRLSGAMACRPARWLSAFVLCALVAYGALARQRHFVNDDGAITLRYAERLSEGKGYTYNDGEKINGTSSV